MVQIHKLRQSIFCQRNSFGILSYQSRSFSENPYSGRKPNRVTNRELLLTLSPHLAVGALFALTSNLSLIVLPLSTAAFHYLYKYNHFA